VSRPRANRGAGANKRKRHEQLEQRMPLAEQRTVAHAEKSGRILKIDAGNLASSTAAYAAWLDDHDRAAGRPVPISVAHADPALVVADEPKGDTALRSPPAKQDLGASETAGQGV